MYLFPEKMVQYTALQMVPNKRTPKMQVVHLSDFLRDSCPFRKIKNLKMTVYLFRENVAFALDGVPNDSE